MTNKTIQRILLFAVYAVAFLIYINFSYVYSQNVQIVSVQGMGQGRTESDAIKDAVLQGIAQVTGQRMQSTESARESSTESNNGKNSYTADYQRKLDAYIRGVAKSYRVISVSNDSSAGLYKAVVEVFVPKYQKSSQLDRFRVAVVAGKIANNVTNQDGDLLSELVSAASEVIVKSHKFALLDRTDNEHVQNEFSKINSDQSAIEESVRLNVKASADFLVIITLVKSSRSSSPVGDRISVTGRIQLLDYASGQTRYLSSRSISAVANNSNSAIRIYGRLANLLASQMMEYGFPSEVIGRSGDMITVDAGAIRFSKDDIVGIYRKAPDVKDSHTNERISGGEELVAKGVVTNANERISMVKIIEGGSRVSFSGTKSQGSYIVRFDSRVGQNLDENSSVTSGNNKNNKSDDDW